MRFRRRYESYAGRKPLPCLLIPLLALPAAGAESIYGGIESITGDGWRVAGLELQLDLSGGALEAEVHVDRLELLASGHTFSDTVIACGRVDFTADEFACRDAAFAVDLPGEGRRTFPGEVLYERRTGAVRFALREVPLAGGRLTASGAMTESGIDIEFRGAELQLAELARVVDDLTTESHGLTASGEAALSGSLRTIDGSVSQAAVKAELSAVSIANEAGTFVTAALDGDLDVRASRGTNGWRFSSTVTADAGEAYIEPVYANLAEAPVSIAAEGIAAIGLGDFDLTRFSLRQASLLDVSGALRVALPATEEEEIRIGGNIELIESSVEALYAGFVQVFVAGTLFGDLETAGTVSGTVAIEENAPAGAELDVRGLSADDRQGRFAIYGLDGTLHWPGPAGEPETTRPTRLDWDAASAYSVPFGSGSIEARLGGDDFLLLEPVRVPTMGGAVVINRLAVAEFGGADATGLLDAELEPIQLGQLTAAFGWPAFSGHLSGKLPLLQYDGGVMTLGGTLSARAFDGEIEFSELQLEQPFGLVPRLSGDLRLRQLDLELVTNTFSFGLIQGRLSGDVTGLEMVAWRPVAMDLHLYTPPGDSSRRRISQRAVENLADVGGGGGAAMALSSGFMQFFEVFAYERIGIRCVLEDGACRMTGAGPAGRGEPGDGYYIVKGSGLPRIDVVGYRSQVSWPRLVRQLENIMESGAPVVNQRGRLNGESE
jgi:hypothetical protein